MSASMRAGERHLGDIVEPEQLGAQAVVDIVRVIGDVVGKRGDLRLGAGEARKFEVCAAGRDRGRNAVR